MDRALRELTLVDLREALLAQGVDLLSCAPVPPALAGALVALGADLDDDGRLKRALAGIAAYVEGTGERVSK